eukprot:TRINITY_DN7022_c0_g1_i1.p1 TRINITY_DN7022_c0_g1~~TRINITY_DN7022_c0_g1_i1.p1  ORF type:complete len:138 (+),score=16.36 TRINITY_DN7022_c0_g1_i1:538-951(+)
MSNAHGTMFRFPTFRDTPTCNNCSSAQASLRDILRRDSESSSSASRPQLSSPTAKKQRQGSTSTNHSASSSVSSSVISSPSSSRTPSPRSSGGASLKSHSGSSHKDIKVETSRQDASSRTFNFFSSSTSSGPSASGR